MQELMDTVAAFAPPALPMLPIVWRRHSFDEPIRELRPAGQSLAEIVASLPQLPERFWRDGVVMVGDEPVPRAMWARVRPKPKQDGSVDVSLWLAPMGGGGGGILKLIASIALLAGALLISGGALAPFAFGGLFAAGSISATIAAAAFTVVGTLALNALSPPPSTAAIDPGALDSGPSRQLTPSSLQGNLQRPGAPFPHVRGTRKIFLPVVVKPFVDLQGDDEVITAVIGGAGPMSLTDIRSDNTPLADISEITYQTREGFSTDTTITLVDIQSKTDANVIELSEHKVDPDNPQNLADQATPTNSIPHWHRMRALGSPDEIRINLRWMQGLFDQDNLTEVLIVPLRLRFRLTSSSTWIYAPEIFFTYRKQETFQKDIRLIFTTAPALPTPETANCPFAAFSGVPMRVETSQIINDASATSVANAFDGNSATQANWAGTPTGYLGANFGGEPRTIAYAILTPDAALGFTSDANITLNLRGKNGSAPASASDGTLLGTTGSIADTLSKVVITSTDTATAYQYIWIEYVVAIGTDQQLVDIRFIAANDYSHLAHSYFWSALTTLYMDATNIGSTPVRRIALHAESARIYLDPVTFPKGDYDIEILRGSVGQKDTFDLERYNETGVSSPYSSFFRWQNPSGTYRVPRSLGGVYHTIARQRFQLKWNTHALLNAPGKLALIAIKATNRQVGQLSCIAKRYVYDYDSGAGTWTTLTTTSNPAPHVRDILAGGLNSDPVPADLIDDVGLIAWRSHCVTNSYQVNAVIEGQSAAVAAQLCAACGYARMRQSETFGVILDKDRSAESAVQTFTSRNSRGYSWQKAYVRFPSGFRAIYADSTNDYQETELIMLDPDGDQGGRYEEIRYDGFVTQAEVQARALFDLEQARLRMTFHSFESNQQAIKCKRGDLIALNHPILTEQMGSAYIREIQTSGANVTGFVLDGMVPISGSDWFFSGPDDFIDDLYGDGLWGPEQLGVVVRLESGLEMTAEINADPTGADEHSRIITLTTPEAVPAGLAEGCLVATGVLGSERLRLIVGEIAPKEGPQFPNSITAVDEAPALWAA